MFSLLFIISFWATLDSAWGLLSAVLSVSLSQPVSVLIYQDFIKLFRIKGFLKRLYWFNNQKWNQYIYIYLLCWLEELENEQLQFSMSKYEENRCDFFFYLRKPKSWLKSEHRTCETFAPFIEPYFLWDYWVHLYPWHFLRQMHRTVDS